MNTGTASSMKRDVVSAYAATATRVLSWVVVLAVVYRSLGADAFAMLTLIRGTLGILTYTFLGLAPAMIHLLAAEAAKPRRVIPVDEVTTTAVGVGQGQGEPLRLAYSNASSGDPRGLPDADVANLYVTGEGLAIALGAVGLAIVAAYGLSLNSLHDIPRPWLEATRTLTLFMGIGIMLRLLSEAPAALLQVRNRISLDNFLLASSEILWAVAVVATARGGHREDLGWVGFCFAISNLLLLIGRSAAGRAEANRLTSKVGIFVRSVAWKILSFGLLVTFGQLANYLYAPIDFILINRLIDPRAVGVYGAAVQIDAGLLLIVSGLAAVLMPKSAVAHAAGDVKTVRKYYVRGTLASTAMLAGASVLVWLLAPWIFRLWLGDPMRATQQILPLVLVNTVIGGSGGVGRSVLLAVGKAKPLTIAVLSAAVGNVIISFCAVEFLHLGLVGVIIGTLCAAVGCFGIWMPWYVLRTLRHFQGQVELRAAGSPTTTPPI